MGMPPDDQFYFRIFHYIVNPSIFGVPPISGDHLWKIRYHNIQYGLFFSISNIYIYII